MPLAADFVLVVLILVVVLIVVLILVVILVLILVLVVHNPFLRLISFGLPLDSVPNFSGLILWTEDKTDNEPGNYRCGNTACSCF